MYKLQKTFTTAHEMTALENYPQVDSIVSIAQEHLKECMTRN